MTRKLLLCAIIIAISGLVPLIAHGGSCQDMPCCHHQGVSFSATGDCCSPSNCARETQVLKSRSDHGPGSEQPPAAIVARLEVAPPASAVMPVVRSPWFEGPPPTTQQRLSVLATFLI